MGTICWNGHGRVIWLICYIVGKELRLKQQYFWSAASLADIMRRFKNLDKPITEFADCAQCYSLLLLPNSDYTYFSDVAIQLNDVRRQSDDQASFTNVTPV